MGNFGQIGQGTGPDRQEAARSVKVRSVYKLAPRKPVARNNAAVDAVRIEPTDIATVALDSVDERAV